MHDRQVLFVCTANLCRSPMAEYLLRARLGPESAWSVASAGVVAADGMPASSGAVAAVAELGIDLGPHLSRGIDRDMVDSADMVVVMTTSHRDQLLAVFPDIGDKVFLMKSFDQGATGNEIEDPIWGTDGLYRKVRDDINTAISGLVTYIAGYDQE